MTPIDEIRVALFVPGDRPDRFEKAYSSGADLVIIDLEDAVPRPGKAAARDHVEAWLGSGHRAAVRINGTETAAYSDDIQMLRRTSPTAVVLPKAEPEGVARLVAEAPLSLPVIALVETASGVLRAHETCSISGVVRAALGHLDLSAELGCDPYSSTISTAADMLVLASATAGLAGPLDGVCTDIDDDARLQLECDRAKQRGCTGKLVVHPRQVPFVRDSFRPRADEVEWARRVLTSAQDGSVFRLDGRMVDEPVLRRARRILEQPRSGTAR